jgi:hypothetical protein
MLPSWRDHTSLREEERELSCVHTCTPACMCVHTRGCECVCTVCRRARVCLVEQMWSWPRSYEADCFLLYLGKTKPAAAGGFQHKGGHSPTL